jgi:iron(III) transport system permease protein
VLALVLVALAALVLVAEGRARRGRYYALGPGAVRPPRPVELGRWRWPAFAFTFVIVGVFLLVPLAVLGYWLARGSELGFAWRPALDSLLVSAAAAGAALVAAIPIALLARYGRAGWTSVLERAAYTSNALPGIVIALSLVFFGARYGGPVYQTLGLLLFAYVVRFLPQALAGTSAALASISPRLEEAAQGLGRTRLQTLASVTLPLGRSGMAAGAALVFLSTMKELPATLLLRPIGFETLATDVWKFTSVGSYSQAALPALLLVAVSAPFLWLLAGRRAAPERVESPG